MHFVKILGSQRVLSTKVALHFSEQDHTKKVSYVALWLFIKAFQPRATLFENDVVFGVDVGVGKLSQKHQFFIVDSLLENIVFLINLTLK